MSSVYGDNVIKMAALQGDDAILYVSKYGSSGIKVIEKYGDNVIRLAKRHGDDVIKYVGMYGGDGLKLARKGKVGLFIMRFMPPKAFVKYGLIAILPCSSLPHIPLHSYPALYLTRTSI